MDKETILNKIEKKKFVYEDSQRQKHNYHMIGLSYLIAIVAIFALIIQIEVFKEQKVILIVISIVLLIFIQINKKMNLAKVDAIISGEDASRHEIMRLYNKLEKNK